jgi:hypothetical protein
MKKDPYKRVAEYYLSKGEIDAVKMIRAAEHVAEQFNIVFDNKSDHHKINASVSNHVSSKKHFRSVIESLKDMNIPVTAVPNAVVTAKPRSNANRVGKCGRRKRTADFVPTSNKRQVPYHGATSHLLYQRGCKAEAIVAL